MEQGGDEGVCKSPLEDSLKKNRNKKEKLLLSNSSYLAINDFYQGAKSLDVSIKDKESLGAVMYFSIVIPPAHHPCSLFQLNAVLF